MTFPFRTAPCREASNVWIESQGNNPAGELGSALLRRGAQIVLASDPRDGDKTKPALDEIELYLRQASQNLIERLILPGGQTQSAEKIEHLRKDGTKTVVLALGPDGGASKTRVVPAKQEYL